MLQAGRKKMSLRSEFKEEYFDYLIGEFRLSVLRRAHGNYTKSYESFKRIENAEYFFLQAVRGRSHVSALDVGCGDGYHLFVFNTNKGIREKVSFRGVDISGLQVEYARRVALGMGFENVQFEAGSAEHLGFPDESFDIVLCSDVVEHLENPETCFAEIRRVLKSGGTAIITTPNPSSMMIKLAGVLRNAGLLAKTQDLEADPQDGGHISLQGLNEWIQMAKKTGFEVRAVRRGALLFGGHAYNRHPVLFALVLLADRLLDVLPIFRNWGEAVTLKLVKP
jgi:2-polyprenyl-3-methyl-5-hydroxy-6-metoxy-1,4-benzoquinol methylase